MNITIDEFRKNAETHGICGMSKDWDNCKSNKQLLDLALSARGLEYVAKAIAEGWGVPADEVCKVFAAFNNGKYVRDKDGYTSALFCSCGSEQDLAEIIASTTAILVIGFNGTIHIPQNRICEMHLVNCECYVKGVGKGIAYIYGNTKILNEKDAPVDVTRL